MKKRLRVFAVTGCGAGGNSKDSLADGLHGEDHAWAEYGDVAVVALEGGDGGVVGGSYRI
jgi:hypothetical protein